MSSPETEVGRGQRRHGLYAERILSGSAHRLHEAKADVAWTLQHLGEAWEIAVQELQSRYARSILGPLWLVIATVSFIGAFSFLGTYLFKMPWTTYLNYLCAGIVIWQFVQSWLIESASMYATAQTSMLATRTPVSYIAVNAMMRNIIMWAHSLPVVAVIAALTSEKPVIWFMVPVGLAMGIIVLFPVGMLLGILATRYRDTVPALASLLAFVVYVSPVWWNPDPITGPARLIVELNPVYHLLRVMRDPFLGVMTPLSTWIGVTVVAALLWGVLALVFYRYRRMIAVWI